MRSTNRFQIIRRGLGIIVSWSLLNGTRQVTVRPGARTFSVARARTHIRRRGGADSRRCSNHEDPTCTALGQAASTRPRNAPSRFKRSAGHAGKARPSKKQRCYIAQSRKPSQDVKHVILILIEMIESSLLAQSSPDVDKGVGVKPAKPVQPHVR